MATDNELLFDIAKSLRKLVKAKELEFTPESKNELDKIV